MAMKRVYSAQNALMVDHLKHVLDTEGIGCAVRNRFLSGVAGQLPPNECWTELWVLDEADESGATDLIRKALETRDASQRETWTCLRCGEVLEAQFESCWKCCTMRGADLDEGVSDEVLSPLTHPPQRQPLQPNVWLVLAIMALVAYFVLRSSEY